MSNKCKSEFSSENFFKGYERRIILIYILLSFILNLIIIISIYLTKNKQISFTIRITASILVVNFINIFAYIFEWVICKTKKNEEQFYIGLLIGNSESEYTCKLQSFFILFSSMSQDYLMILLFYIVNQRKVIKVMIIDLLIFVCILVPIIIGVAFLLLDAFGVNEDFCYLKKYEKDNEIDTYKINKSFVGLQVIVYGIRAINFSVTIYFLINIIKYIKKEKKSISYIFKQLFIFFIQLFKLFIILIYRIPAIIPDVEYHATVRKVYYILSTVDGVLMPLAYIISNEIYLICFNKNKRRKFTEEEKDVEETIMPNSPLISHRKSKKNEDTLVSNNESKGVFIASSLCNNTNNFDLSIA